MVNLARDFKKFDSTHPDRDRLLDPLRERRELRDPPERFEAAELLLKQRREFSFRSFTCCHCLTLNEISWSQNETFLNQSETF